MALYDYGNTRLRARISRLFSPQELESLGHLTSIDTFISTLSKTHYKASIEKALTYAHGYDCVTEALRRESEEIVRDVKRFYAPELWKKIRIIFTRKDLQNIKAIFRGIIHGVQADDIVRSLSPLGTVSSQFIIDIAKSKNIETAIDKVFVYRIDFAENLQELKKTSDSLSATKIERELEMWYFQRMKQILSGRGEDIELLRTFVEFHADIVNLNTLLRFVDAPQYLAEDEEPIDYYLIASGSLPTNRLIALSEEKSVASVIKGLSFSKHSSYLLKALDCYRQTGQLSEFENQMHKALLTWQTKLPKQYPFGVGVPIGYVALKFSEIRNLRWLSRGIYSGFEPSFINENLERTK